MLPFHFQRIYVDVGILTSVTLKIFGFLLPDSVSAWLSLVVFPMEDVFFISIL